MTCNRVSKEKDYRLDENVALSPETNYEENISPTAIVEPTANIPTAVPHRQPSQPLDEAYFKSLILPEFLPENRPALVPQRQPSQPLDEAYFKSLILPEFWPKNRPDLDPYKPQLNLVPTRPSTPTSPSDFFPDFPNYLSDLTEFDQSGTIPQVTTKIPSNLSPPMDAPVSFVCRGVQSASPTDQSTSRRHRSLPYEGPQRTPHPSSQEENQVKPEQKRRQASEPRPRSPDRLRTHLTRFHQNSETQPAPGPIIRREFKVQPVYPPVPVPAAVYPFPELLDPGSYHPQNDFLWFSDPTRPEAKRRSSVQRNIYLSNRASTKRRSPASIKAIPNPSVDIETLDIRPNNRDCLAKFRHGIAAHEAFLHLQEIEDEQLMDYFSYDASRIAYIPRWHAISNFFYEVASHARQPPHSVLVTMLSLKSLKRAVIVELAAAHNVQCHRCTKEDLSINWILFKGDELPANAQDMNEAIETAERWVLRRTIFGI